VTEFLRTSEENFANLPGYAFEPHYHGWQDLRVHYVDEGPRDGPVALLLHGMPTWAFLYRRIMAIGRTSSLSHGR
jgi:haloalkane dehalogenase